MGLSWPHFGSIFFLFYWYIVILQLINFTMVNEDRKQERRRKSIHCSITCYKKKPDTYRQQIDGNSEQKKVHPRIRIWPAQTEWHCFTTTCATTPAKKLPALIDRDTNQRSKAVPFSSKLFFKKGKRKAWHDVTFKPTLRPVCYTSLLQGLRIT